MSYPYQIRSMEEYESAYQKSVNEPVEFWSSVASNFQWKQGWDKILDWNFKEPRIEWFKGAKLNITDGQGKSVKTISLNSAQKSVTINSDELNTGNYFYELIVDGRRSSTRQMMVIR